MRNPDVRLGLIDPKVQQENRLKLELLQEMLKYGLSSPHATTIYEMGFSDRNLSVEIEKNFRERTDSIFRSDIREKLKTNLRLQQYIMKNYPENFQERLRDIVS